MCSYGIKRKNQGLYWKYNHFNRRGFTNYKIEKKIADSPRILAIGGTIDGEIINKLYYRKIKRLNVPIVKCMTDTIKELSTLDWSVNTNTFVVTI